MILTRPLGKLASHPILFPSFPHLALSLTSISCGSTLPLLSYPLPSPSPSPSPPLPLSHILPHAASISYLFVDAFRTGPSYVAFRTQLYRTATAFISALGAGEGGREEKRGLLRGGGKAGRKEGKRMWCFRAGEGGEGRREGRRYGGRAGGRKGGGAVLW